MISQYNIRFISIERKIFSKLSSLKSKSIIVKGASVYNFNINNTNYFSTNTKQETKISFIDKLIGEESNVASESFKNRWLMAIPAFATHMCIGSPWAWSIMADVCTRQIG